MLPAAQMRAPITIPCQTSRWHAILGLLASLDRLGADWLAAGTQVTHLGYYETEEGAARVYDRVSLSLHGPHAQTNFPAAEYAGDNCAQYSGLNREELQRALGVKPMDKSSRCALCLPGHAAAGLHDREA